MTEDEAKTKWCPFTNAVGTTGREIGAFGNRIVNKDESVQAVPVYAHCIGSACMAWRVLTRMETRHRDGHAVQPGEIYLRGNVTTHEVSDGGYCGLARAAQ